MGKKIVTAESKTVGYHSSGLTCSMLTLILIIFFVLKISAAYFRGTSDHFFLKEQSDLSTYCLQNRLQMWE